MYLSAYTQLQSRYTRTYKHKSNTCRFLSTRHYGCFFVFNLCDTYFSGDGVTGNYHPAMLYNQVTSDRCALVFSRVHHTSIHTLILKCMRARMLCEYVSLSRMCKGICRRFSRCYSFFTRIQATQTSSHTRIQVMRIPFEDHGPPLLIEMIEFCREASKWLQLNPKNVIAVHCKGGKGRTVSPWHAVAHVRTRAHMHSQKPFAVARTERVPAAYVRAHNWVCIHASCAGTYWEKSVS